MNKSYISRNELAKYIGMRIQERMEICEIDISELANELYIPEATLYNYIHGRNIPTLVTLANITVVLECDIYDIVGEIKWIMQEGDSYED